MSHIAKAVWAFLTSLLEGLILVAPGGITLIEWLTVALAVVTVTGGVYGLTNTSRR